jgi:hypothetical protein
VTDDGGIVLGALAAGGAPADRVLLFDSQGELINAWDTPAETTWVDSAGDQLYTAAFTGAELRAYRIP